MINPKIIELRRELHKHPELSGFELETSKRIKDFIQKHNPTKIIENIGGCGLAAIYEYSNEGPTIAIRCELDALPIQEMNDFTYRSSIEGVSHKCGHDGHMAIVAGLIFWLKHLPVDSGKIILLFQPSEENGQGALKVLEDEKFMSLKPDFIFALHNIPGEALHSVITMDDGFSAEVISFVITLSGKESHAAEPENGINPAVGISEIIDVLSSLIIEEPTHADYRIVTPIHINMGQKSYGVSAAYGELHYTIRTWTKEKMDILKTEIVDVVGQICQNHNLEHKLNWLEYFPASINNIKSTELVKLAAKSNGVTLIERPYPFKFGEDFGWFSKDYKTTMFGIGAGADVMPLHNAQYDFPDEIIETGINMFKTIITTLLNQSD